MAQIDDRPNEHDHTHLAPRAPDTMGEAPLDTRKPYEPPRLMKKRSLAHATLFTAHGPTTNAITMMG